MLKILAQFSSKFHTLENQFEQGSGRFVDPEPPFKMGPHIRAPKKNKNTPQKKNMKPNAYFCRKEPFCNQKKLFLVSMALGGKKQKRKPQIADVQKNTTKQGVLFIFVLVLRYSFLPKTTFQLNKTTYTK